MGDASKLGPDGQPLVEEVPKTELEQLQLDIDDAVHEVRHRRHAAHPPTVPASLTLLGGADVICA